MLVAKKRMRTRFIILLGFVLVSQLLQCQTKEYKEMLKGYYNDFPIVSLSDALDHLKNKNATFLDVRELNEFKVSHIRTAKRMDPNGSTIDKLTLSKDQIIIVYCSIGARSQSFGEMLKEKGYTKVYNLYGGLFNWANHKFPLVDNKGKTTTHIHGYSRSWGKWVTEGIVVY